MYEWYLRMHSTQACVQKYQTMLLRVPVLQLISNTSGTIKICPNVILTALSLYHNFTKGNRDEKSCKPVRDKKAWKQVEDGT